MKNKINSGAKGAKKNSLSIKDGPFFSSESKKRQKISNDVNGDFIESSESDEELVGDSDREDREEAEEDETAKETADETRKRFAIAHLEKLREIARRQKEDEEDELSGKESDDEGQRDSLVAQILQQEQLEESGRTRRAIASRVQQPETTDDFRVIVKHRQSVNAVVLSEDDSRGFSASKDGTIMHWDVDGGKCEKYRWPSDELLRSHGARDPQGRARHSKNVLALAISSDGRYLASGGTDRHVHLWDTRTREHIQAFPGHRGTVSCLTFRQGSSEIFSGSYDRTVKIWNVEDRAYINTLFGHQSEVLSIDCLRKERVLAVGRDRTMQLFKVPEESRLVFRAPASSLECCCFINNDEFLTGSDDGSFAMWNLLRKKPVCIIKNAHALSTAEKNIDREDIERIPNGHIENGDYKTERFNHSSACSWVSSVTVCRNSDLAASGAGNGSVHLWAIANESKEVKALYDLPLAGFVNSLAFAKSGAFLVAGVAQEPRLGRWGRIPAARNGVAVHTIKLS